MIEPGLDPKVQDTVARNMITHGQYFLVSFHRGDEPVVVYRGMDEKRYTIVQHELKSARQPVT